MNDNEKYQNKYRIPSARATWHDYNGGAYFITVCTKNHEYSFGEIVLTCRDAARHVSDNGNDTQCKDAARHVSTNGEPTMRLSPIGQCVFDNLQNVSAHYPYVEIPLFVVMPNHWHAIVFIDGERGRDVTRYVSTADKTKNQKMVEIAKHQSLLSWTIRGIKSAVTKFANENVETYHDTSLQKFAWQTRFHDRIIRDQKMMNNIAEYIENNVARWDNDCFNENTAQCKNV